MSDVRSLSQLPDVAMYVADDGRFWGGDLATAENLSPPEGAVLVDPTGVGDFWAERDKVRRRLVAEGAALAQQERARDRKAIIELMQARGASEAEIELNLRLLGL